MTEPLKPIVDSTEYSTVICCYLCSWRSVHNSSEDAEREWQHHCIREHPASVHARRREYLKKVTIKRRRLKRKPKRKLRRLKRHRDLGAK